jgi:hypothetical protein
MDHTHIWACPACGNHVRLSGGIVRPHERVEPDRLDRVAHAACGCYVLTMPAGQVGRLLASVLVAGSDEDPLDEGSGISVDCELLPG